jgi:hypothetical protein
MTSFTCSEGKDERKEGIRNLDNSKECVLEKCKENFSQNYKSKKVFMEPFESRRKIAFKIQKKS